MTQVMTLATEDSHGYLQPVMLKFRNEGLSYAEISDKIHELFKVTVDAMEVHMLTDSMADEFPEQLADLLPLNKITNHVLDKGYRIREHVTIDRTKVGDFSGIVEGDTEDYTVRIQMIDDQIDHRCTCKAKIWRPESWCSHEIAFLWAIFEVAL